MTDLGGTAVGTTLLAVNGLRVTAAKRDGSELVLVDDLSLSVAKGRSLGVVGESGSGKSMTALSVLGLLPRGVKVTSGSIVLDGDELLAMQESQLRAIRGQRIGMVFQDPMTSLNPLRPVGLQVTESLVVHQELSRKEARIRAVSLLEEVGIADASRRVDDYPHHFSGGMRQRIMIAAALACDPDVLIADEATTALDVTVQANILALLRRLRDDRDLSLLMISHDLGVVSEVVDDVVVMYAGQVVEAASSERLFQHPQHPYTEALLDSVPRIEGPHTRAQRFQVIPGQPPLAGSAGQHGCRFEPRCPYAGTTSCFTGDAPELREVASNHFSRSLHGPEMSA